MDSVHKLLSQSSVSEATNATLQYLGDFSYSKEAIVHTSTILDKILDKAMLRNTTDFNLILNFLYVLSSNNYFHENEGAFRKATSFVVENITYSSKIEGYEQITVTLLQVLGSLLDKSNLSNEDPVLIVIKDVLLPLLTATSSKGSVLYIPAIEIAQKIIQMGYSDASLVEASFSHLMETNELLEACRLATICLRNEIPFGSDVITMIFSNAQKYLSDNNFKDLTCIKFLSLLSAKYTGSFANIYVNLNNICVFSATESEAKTLLANILIDYCSSKNIPWINSHVVITKLVKELPENLDQWPFSSNDIFFFIAYLLNLYSKPLWNTEAVTMAIYKRLITPYYLPIPILRAIIYLYAKTRDPTHPHYDFFKLRLPQIIQECGVLPHIFTCQYEDLAWLLEDAPKPLAQTAIKIWYSRGADLDVLVKCAGKKEIKDILVQMVEAEPEMDASESIIEVLKLVSTPEEFLDNTEALLRSLNNPNVFSQLVRHKLKVPIDVDIRLKLCKLFGVMLGCLTRRESIINACEFARKLLLTMKNSTEAVKHFCVEKESIKGLIAFAGSSDEELGATGIKLLTLLVKLQLRNNVFFDDNVSFNVSSVLKAPSSRISEAYSLIKIFKKYKKNKFIVEANPEDDRRLFMRLLHLSCSDKNVFNRLIDIIEEQNDLASDPILMTVIEQHCYYPIENCSFTEDFVNLLKLWAAHQEDLEMVENYIRVFLSIAPKELNAKEALQCFYT